MSNLSVEASGLVGQQKPAAKEEEKKKQEPQSILKNKEVRFQEYGSNPPPLNIAPAPSTYNEKLEAAYPSARNSSDPTNRQLREVFFLVKDFGYDNFEKNSTIISKYKELGKLDNLAEI